MAEQVEIDLVPKVAQEAIDRIATLIADMVEAKLGKIDPAVLTPSAAKPSAAKSGAAPVGGGGGIDVVKSITEPIVNAVKSLKEKLGSATESSLKKVHSAFSNVLGVDVVGSVNSGLKLIKGAFTKVFDLVAGQAKMMMKGVGVLLEFTNGIAKFVEAANPAVVEMLNQVFQDIQGVVGRVLTPVLKALIPLFRMFGDFLAVILPSQKQMNELMATLQPIVDEIKNVFELLAPVVKEVIDEALKLLIDVLKELMPAIKDIIKTYGDLVILQVKVLIPILKFVASTIVWVAKTINDIIQWLVGKVRWLLKKLGIDLPSDTPNAPRIEMRGQSMNASAREASFVGIEDLGKRLQAKAFGAAIGPEERTAKATEEMAGILRRESGRPQPQLS